MTDIPYEFVRFVWWALLLGLLLLALALFLLLLLPLRLFGLLKRLKTHPPQSFAEWCRRLSGSVLLVVVAVGGSLLGVAGAEYYRIGNTPYLCATDVFGRGFLGTTGPGMTRYLDALTDGSTGEHEFFGESAAGKARGASAARLDFLKRHTQYGRCAPVDEEQYMYWVRKMSAERDWPEAHYLLALRYGYGGFVDGKLDVNPHGGGYSFARPDNAGEVEHIPLWAMDWYQVDTLPSNQGSGEGLDLEKSFALLKEAAEKGDLRAASALERAYVTGFWGKDNAMVVEVDYEKATQSHERYIKGYGGNVYTFYTVGHRYHHAEEYGLRRDDAKAYEYMAKVASSERRHGRMLDAMLELALMYKEGVGVVSSAEEARVWLGKAEQELALMDEEGRKAVEVLRDESNIALVRQALAQKRRKFEKVKFAIGSVGGN